MCYDQQTSSFGLAVSDIVIWERERENKGRMQQASKLRKIFIMTYYSSNEIICGLNSLSPHLLNTPSYNTRWKTYISNVRSSNYPKKMKKGWYGYGWDDVSCLMLYLASSLYFSTTPIKHTVWQHWKKQKIYHSQERFIK